MAAIVGTKIGMTQVFTEDGVRVPVTVVEAAPNTVTAVRVPDRDGYAAIQVAALETGERKLTKAQLGHLKKAGAPASRKLKEFRDEGPEAQVGEQLTVEQFEPGTKVKVSATSVGKGFQGTVKRHNFARGPVSHGSHNVRAPGSVGASADPARVFKGVKMPGRMGGKRITQRGLEIFQVDAERNLLLIRGAVPGPKGGTVEVRSDG
ncbi:MAG: large subunit ribosomal protein [Thermoleophilaceae bacterium]|nr:large subunit ribosomal protein [Thermoleophilaceae bacterium]